MRASTKNVPARSHPVRRIEGSPGPWRLGRGGGAAFICVPAKNGFRDVTTPACGHAACRSDAPPVSLRSAENEHRREDDPAGQEEAREADDPGDEERPD